MEKEYGKKKVQVDRLYSKVERGSYLAPISMEVYYIKVTATGKKTSCSEWASRLILIL